MKSFEHDYLLETPISHQFLSSVRMLGEFRGRQALYAEQSPEVLETLKRAAIIHPLPGPGTGRRMGEDFVRCHLI